VPFLSAVATVFAVEASAEASEIAPEQWKSLSKAVRIVKRDYVGPVDDARLAGACADRVHALPSLRSTPPAPPVTALTDVPVLLRAAATAATDLPPAHLVVQCLTGMLASLDAHSRYVPADEAREWVSGSAGVGLELTMDENTVIVFDAIEGGPAAAAGIRPGDRVAAIGGRSLDGLALHEVTRRLVGRSGSVVTVTIARGADVLEFPLTRGLVKATTAKSQVVAPGYLHLRIRRFGETTTSEIDAAIAPLLERVETTPRALLLDLRHNGGGLFRTAIDLAAAMVPPNTVIGSTTGRSPTANHRVMGDRRSWARENVAEWLRTVPTAVLVNGGTTSGAEIVASALQAHGRALLLGTPTRGMGAIQTLIPLDDGAQLRLTTAAWLTPKGESLEGHPLTPDVLLVSARGVVPVEGERDTELQQAIEVLKTRRATSR
jgi:carboxyl-terminal processing protease